MTNSRCRRHGARMLAVDEEAVDLLAGVVRGRRASGKDQDGAKAYREQAVHGVFPFTHAGTHCPSLGTHRSGSSDSNVPATGGSATATCEGRALASRWVPGYMGLP